MKSYRPSTPFHSLQILCSLSGCLELTPPTYTPGHLFLRRQLPPQDVPCPRSSLQAGTDPTKLFDGLFFPLLPLPPPCFPSSVEPRSVSGSQHSPVSRYTLSYKAATDFMAGERFKPGSCWSISESLALLASMKPQAPSMFIAIITCSDAQKHQTGHRFASREGLLSSSKATLLFLNVGVSFSGRYWYIVFIRLSGNC